jgi:hypothetical protein
VQDLLSDVNPVVYFVQTGNVENAESNLLACDFKGRAIVKIHISGDLLEAVGHLNCRVASQ